jgi:hypothetical protein
MKYAEVFAAQGKPGIKDNGSHIFPEIYIDRGDTRFKFAISVNDAWGKLAAVLMTPMVIKPNSNRLPGTPKLHT